MLTFLVLLAIGSLDGSHAVTAAARTEFDCGSVSLSTLLTLEGWQHPITKVVAALPPQGEVGRSLADLRDGAAKLGLSLDGVQIDPTRRPRRPALVFLDETPHGHFVVIRPVGPSGRLIQVIDPWDQPAILDWADLVKSRSWTGRGLVASHFPWSKVAGLLGVVGVLFLGGSLLRALGHRLPQKPVAPSRGRVA